MKTRLRSIEDDNERALMIARKKEKERILTMNRKPSKPAEWLKLIEDMDTWYKQNQWSMDIDDYAVAKGYAPYKIYRDWPAENELFKEHIATLYAFLKQRHNNLMISEGKMSQLIMKERPLYNPRLADYEQSLRKDDDTKPTAMTVHFKEIPRTDALDKHEREKNEKDPLE